MSSAAVPALDASSTPSSLRQVGVMLLAGLVVAWAVWAAHRPHPVDLRLPLPIAGDAGFPVPVRFWLGMAVYAWAAGALLRLPARAAWGSALRLGLPLHLLVLLAALVPSLAPAEPAFTSRWYLLGAQSVVYGALAAGVAWSAALVAARMAQTARACFLLPGVIVTGMLAVAAWRAHPVWAAAAIAIGIGGWRARPALSRIRVRDWVFVALVMAAAFGVRAFYATRVMTNPDYLATGSDGKLYDMLAWNLVQGQPVPVEVAQKYPFLVPGYVRFVALIYRIAGRSYLAVCLAQAALGALVCGLAFVLTRRLFGVAVARVTAVFAALDFPMVFAAAAMGHQAVDLFLSALVIWMLVRYIDSAAARGRWAAAIGLVLGWSVVTRESNGVFWLGLMAWFAASWAKRIGARQALTHALAISAGVVLMVAPFVYSEIFKPGHGGSFHERMGRLVFHNSPYKVELPANPVSDPAGAWAALRRDPASMLGPAGKSLAWNFGTLFFSQEYGRFDPVFLVRDSAFYLGMWWYAYALCLAGASVALARLACGAPGAAALSIILIFLASRSLVHLLLETGYRYRTPLEPYLIMLTACGLLWLYGRPVAPVGGRAA